MGAVDKGGPEAFVFQLAFRVLADLDATVAERGS